MASATQEITRNYSAFDTLFQPMPAAAEKSKKEEKEQESYDNLEVSYIEL